MPVVTWCLAIYLGDNREGEVIRRGENALGVANELWWQGIHLEDLITYQKRKPCFRWNVVSVVNGNVSIIRYFCTILYLHLIFYVYIICILSNYIKHIYVYSL